MAGFLQRCYPGEPMPPGDTGGTGGTTTVNVAFPDQMQVKNPVDQVFATYDGANQGTFIPIQIDPIGLTETSITFSSSTFRRSTDLAFSATLTGDPPKPAAATNYQYMLNNVERVLMTNDTGIILSEAVDTAFNEDYAGFAPSNAVVDQLICNFAVALNVSAYTAGSFNLNSVDLTLRSYANAGAIDNTSPTSSVRISPNSTFTALTATGTLILICKTVINGLQFRINGAQPFTLNITINETTGTGTRNIGLLNNFPYLTTNASKLFYPSTIIAHTRAVPDSLSKITQYTPTKISGVSV